MPGVVKLLLLAVVVGLGGWWIFHHSSGHGRWAWTQGGTEDRLDFGSGIVWTVVVLLTAVVAILQA